MEKEIGKRSYPIKWVLLLSLTFLISFLSYAQSKGKGEDAGYLKPPYLIDKFGRVIIYHGVSVSHSVKKSEDFLPWQKKEDFARLKEWGFNLVRYFILWEAVEPASGQYNEKYMQRTLERLQWLDELGIDVLLCIHQDLFSKRYGGGGFPPWAVDDDDLPFTPVSPHYKNYFTKPVMVCFDNFWRSEVLKNSYVEMVKYVLSHVHKQPNLVGLEMFDNPWPHVGSGFEQTILTEFYQRIEKMKVNNNFQTPLYFQPMSIVSVVIPTALQFQPVDFAVYAVRYFDPFFESENSTYGKTNRWLMSTTISQRVRETRRWGLPMVVTDFSIGPNISESLKYLNDWFAIMDQYQLGWIYNSFDRDTDNPSGMLDSEGNTKPMLSKLIQTYPQRIAGKNPIWFTKGNLFKLTYEPEGNTAATVIFIPKSDVARQVAVNSKPYPYNPFKDLRFEYKASPTEKTVTIVVQW